MTHEKNCMCHLCLPGSVDCVKEPSIMASELHITRRAAVEWFADQMEAKLVENDHKGGWKNCTLDYLISRLRQEINELELELLKPNRDPVAIVRESVDASNFALMIADQHAHRYGE